MNRWYMHNPESARVNESHKLLRDFEIQTDYLISARRPDLVIVNQRKENLQNSGLCRSEWPQDKTERNRKTVEHESDGDTNCDWCTRYSHQRIGTGIERLGNKRTHGDHPNYSIVEYWEMSWRFEETSCYSNFRKRPSVSTGVKNSQERIIIILKKRKLIKRNRIE